MGLFTLSTSDKIAAAARKLPEKNQELLLKELEAMVALSIAQEIDAAQRTHLKKVKPPTEKELIRICREVRHSLYEERKRLRA